MLHIIVDELTAIDTSSVLLCDSTKILPSKYCTPLFIAEITSDFIAVMEFSNTPSPQLVNPKVIFLIRFFSVLYNRNHCKRNAYANFKI